jgi:hypothetical protein
MSKLKMKGVVRGLIFNFGKTKIVFALDNSKVKRILPKSDAFNVYPLVDFFLFVNVRTGERYSVVNNSFDCFLGSCKVCFDNMLELELYVLAAEFLHALGWLVEVFCEANKVALLKWRSLIR